MVGWMKRAGEGMRLGGNGKKKRGDIQGRVESIGVGKPG